MDRKERFNSFEETLRAAVLGYQSELWTALPGTVTNFNPFLQTCEVQPGVKMKFTDPVTGAHTWVDLPLLLDCPVYFPSGGGCTLTFPVKTGDECLVVFASRCIDQWWADNNPSASKLTHKQALLRMHDLSDGFVFVGTRSKGSALGGFTLSGAQLRTNDGKSHVHLDTAANSITIKASGTDTSTVNITSDVNVTLGAPKIIISGDVIITGKVTNNGVNIGSTHVHGGVEPGMGNSGGPM